MKKLNKKGFTLVELLAVIVLLAIVATALAGAVFSTMNKAKRNTFITTYNDIVKQVMADSMQGEIKYISDSEQANLKTYYDLNDTDYYLVVYQDYLKNGSYTCGAGSVVIHLKGKGTFNQMTNLETNSCKKVTNFK